jgi:hypothetical protein
MSIFLFSGAPNLLRLGPPPSELATWILEEQGYHFQKRCEKISTVMCTGQFFKAESVVDKYALLPSFWHGTRLEYKKKIVGIIDKHNGFSPECIMELEETCHIIVLQIGKHLSLL